MNRSVDLSSAAEPAPATAPVFRGRNGRRTASFAFAALLALSGVSAFAAAAPAADSAAANARARRPVCVSTLMLLGVTRPQFERLFPSRSTDRLVSKGARDYTADRVFERITAMAGPFEGQPAVFQALAEVRPDSSSVAMRAKDGSWFSIAMDKPPSSRWTRLVVRARGTADSLAATRSDRRLEPDDLLLVGLRLNGGYQALVLRTWYEPASAPSWDDDLAKFRRAFLLDVAQKSWGEMPLEEMADSAAVAKP
jgi:hypothetical protein